MDKALVMDRLFKLLREFPEFEDLRDMQYDEKNGLVRAKIGIAEKVIPIKDDSTWMGIVREVLTELEKEKLWNVYLDMTNGGLRLQNHPRSLDVMVVGANCGRGIGCSRLTEKSSARIV